MNAPAGAPPFPQSSFDSVVLAAVVAECQTLIGARVGRVHQAGPDGLALVLRGRRSRTLLASIHPQWGRVHLARNVTPSEAAPFAQQARSRLEGATVRSIAAPLFERILTCGFETLEGPLDLIVEIMGRHSNIILASEGIIAGAHRVIGADRARSRQVLPHRPYVPPSQPRPNPSTVAAEDLARHGARGPADPPAWRAVLEAVAGVGPALAHEACARADIDPLRPLEPAAAGHVADALHALGEAVRAGRFAPVLYRDGAGMPAAYGPFPMRIYQNLPVEDTSMSVAIEQVTAEVAEAARTEGFRQALAATVTQASRRVQRALAAVAGDVRAAEDAERWREQGELILAYLATVTPGARTVEVPGFDGRPTTISLDPTRSGVENAQAYFKRYAKAAAARKRLPERQAALDAERVYLDSVTTAIEQAEGQDDLWEVEQDLIAAGLRKPAGLRKRTRAAARLKAASGPRVFELVGGYRVRVGRSASENDYLTFEIARPDDLWFHARGMAGAHVILSGGGREPSDAAIAAAARIAAHYSAGRAAAKVPVDVTARRFVRRVRRGRHGQVVYTNERTITVPPGLPDRARSRAPG